MYGTLSFEYPNDFFNNFDSYSVLLAIATNIPQRPGLFCPGSQILLLIIISILINKIS